MVNNSVISYEDGRELGSHGNAFSLLYAMTHPVVLGKGFSIPLTLGTEYSGRSVLDPENTDPYSQVYVSGGLRYNINGIISPSTENPTNPCGIDLNVKQPLYISDATTLDPEKKTDRTLAMICSVRF